MEIGSEYWKCDEILTSNNENFWKFGKDNKFVLSGRTAIFYVLKDILEKRNIKKVYFPSYSCTSMVQPFKDLNIEIEYYDVYYNNGLKYNINLDEECDIFFAMNYFGYSQSNMEKYIKYFKSKNTIVIEDITHSILSEKKFSNYSDYLVGSLRKWFPIISGGIAINANNKFLVELSSNTNYGMINTKKIAMENKEKYLKNKFQTEEEKLQFLNQYSKSSKILENDYKNYKIDNESYQILMEINLQKIISQRKENAKLIYKKLKNKLNVKFLFENYNENDCLLFVPIILENKIRNELRKYLTNNKIYLPIHWPLEQKLNNIFENELSLICDQRYDLEEINYYLYFIEKFFTLNNI